MPKLLAPDFGGVWSWEGELTPATMLKLSNGREVSLGSIITLTNGDVLYWLDKQTIEKHLAGQHDQSTHGHGNSSASHQHFDTASYARNISSTESLEKVIARTRFPASDGSGDYPADAYIDAASVESWHNLGYLPDSPEARIVFGSLDKDFHTLVENNPISVFVREENLAGILDSGRFKNATEVAQDSVATWAGKDDSYMAQRTVYENVAFGYNNETLPEQRPITGLVAPNGIMNQDAYYTYGQVQVDLKDSVKERSTFTIGDSLNEYLPPIDFKGTVPFSRNYSHLAQDTYNAKQLQSKAGVPNPKGPILNDWWHEENYVEAQVHSGVKVSDIAKVTFHDINPSKVSAQTARLDALGIPYEFSGEDWRDD